MKIIKALIDCLGLCTTKTVTNVYLDQPMPSTHQSPSLQSFHTTLYRPLKIFQLLSRLQKKHTQETIKAKMR